MCKSIRHRLPGGYLWEKKKLHNMIVKTFPDDKLAIFLYEIWRYRYWHLFRSFDAQQAFRQLFPEGFFCVGDQRFFVPNNEDVDTFLWEYPDLIMPLMVSDYQYDRIKDLFDEGPYELNEKVAVDNGDVVIDCGANLGYFSAAVANKAKHIYSFEPAVQLCETYLEPLKKMHSNITIVKKGLAAESGERLFRFYPNSSGSSCLSTGNMQIEKEMQMCEENRISCVSLDDYVEKEGLKQVDFIKADIEGAERELLQGAEKTLKRFAPKLSICTYHLPDDKEVLEKIIKTANPNYTICHMYKKLYAYVKKE